MIEIVSSVPEVEWNSFLSVCDNATIYHTPEWKTFLEKTFSYESKYLFARDESENIIGFLPLFYVKSKLTGNRLCSAPFSHICGPLGNNNASINLIEEAIRLYEKSRSNSLEIRSLVDNERFLHLNSFSTYILELSPNTSDVWPKLSKGSVRWAIKKAHKSGVIVEATQDINVLKEFSNINDITKKELGVPCHPWIFFKNMFDILGKYVSLYVSKYSGEIIGGGVMEYFKDTVLYGYGASDPDYLNLHPYNAFIWKSIEDACASGYKKYDFGRTSYDNTGLINFKKRWGAAEVKLYYSNYPADSTTLNGDRNNIKYQMAKMFIQKMPHSIYKKFSDGVFQHLG